MWGWVGNAPQIAPKGDFRRHNTKCMANGQTIIYQRHYQTSLSSSLPPTHHKIDYQTDFNRESRYDINNGNEIGDRISLILTV